MFFPLKTSTFDKILWVCFAIHIGCHSLVSVMTQLTYATLCYVTRRERYRA